MAFKRRKRKRESILKKFHYVENGQVKRIETSIEKKIRLLLSSMGLLFEQEKYVAMGRYRKKYDFFVNKQDEYSFFIECHGEYFHPGAKNPSMDKFKRLTKLQKKNARNDVVKVKIAKKLGIPLITLWESHINNGINYCKRIIAKEVNRQQNIYLEEDKDEKIIE